jgi:hypothetical protein
MPNLKLSYSISHCEGCDFAWPTQVENKGIRQSKRDRGEDRGKSVTYQNSFSLGRTTPSPPPCMEGGLYTEEATGSEKSLRPCRHGRLWIAPRNLRRGDCDHNHQVNRQEPHICVHSRAQCQDQPAHTSTEVVITKVITIWNKF